ncbi:hypothetical protein QWJ34_17435 [Saccharibacillus sp. CPCC 101409]|uniref:hypothetical protein n=1 Tax=Saccharibacillus sp. CPCC 101409 TaxID=3058041 RepID=UPI00267239C7|nr:hypothetical protein [Saccharibacillus sp. CPCC 101409]MDO3411551.1 hypothetical protein [Saccharibacillus sp. CPCC 101409]
MKKRTVCRIAICLLAVLLMPVGPGASVQADSSFEYADASVKKQIETELRRDYADSLNADKSSYKTDGSFEEAELDDGVAVYGLDAANDSLTRIGYEFPLRLNKAVVGTVSAEKNADGWSISRVGSSSDLPAKLQSAVGQAPPGARLQYVHDPSAIIPIRGFLIRSDNGDLFFDVNTNRSYPAAELYASVRRIAEPYDRTYSDAHAAVGTGSVSSTGLLLASGAIIAGAAIVALFFFKKKRTRSTANRINNPEE